MSKKKWEGTIAIIALAASLLSLSLDAYNSFRAKRTKIESGLTVTYDLSSRVCLVDVLLQNSGDKTAIIESISIEALDSARIGRSRLSNSMTIMRSSETYDIDISSLLKKGAKISRKVTYSLKPDDTDRFELRLAALKIPKGLSIEVPLRISFIVGDRVFHGEEISVKLDSYQGK